jgi:hypothetical protein
MTVDTRKVFSVLVGSERRRIVAQTLADAQRDANALGGDPASWLELASCGWTPVPACLLR